MAVPKVQADTSVIGAITAVTDPVGTKNIAGAQINPATQDTLALAETAIEAINTAIQAGGITQTQLAAIQVAVQLIDNFIAGARGLVTEDNSAAILAELDVALSTRALEAGGNLASILAKFVPLDKASLHGLAKGAGADYFVADLAPTNTPCLFRILIAIDGAGVFSAKITKGGVAKVCSFNTGQALIADSLYTFDLLVHAGDTINLQHTVAANIDVCRVQEIVGGVQ